MKQIRLGLVGAGCAGRLHQAAALRQPERFTVGAIADPDNQAATELAAQTGAAVFRDHESLADSGLVDAVVICSPHNAHLRQVTYLLEMGIPVLVEKPMALSSQDCETMRKIAECGGVPLATGYIQRYRPCMEAMRQMLTEGIIGGPRLVIDRRSARYERGTRPEWFFDPRVGGGGILANLGSHSVDKLFCLTGRDLVDVSASWSPIRGADGVATDVAAMLHLEGGIVASLLITGTGLPAADLTEVICEDGALRLSAEGVQVFRDGELIRHWPTAENDLLVAFDAQLADFYEAAITGRSPVVDATYGARVVAAVECVAAAAGMSIAAADPTV